MPYEIGCETEFFGTREQRIKNFLLTQIKNNWRGISIDSLWEEARLESSLKDDKLVPRDIGPALSELSRENRVEGKIWCHKEGERIFYKPVFRPKWTDRITCLFLGHALLDNCAFESQGALFVGGVCARCKKLVQGKFLGNVWTSEKEEDGIIILSGYDLTPAFEKNLQVCQIP